MVDLVWYDFYEMGVESIDREHMEILAIMREVQLAIMDNDMRRCANQLDALMVTASRHFENEEAYLAEVQYPKLKEHALYHKEMLKKAQGVKSMCESIEAPHDVKACFDAMASFLIDDILHGDIEFKSYLEYEGHIAKKLR